MSKKKSNSANDDLDQDDDGVVREHQGNGNASIKIPSIVIPSIHTKADYNKNGASSANDELMRGLKKELREGHN